MYRDTSSVDKECYEVEVQPHQKTDYNLML